MLCRSWTLISIHISSPGSQDDALKKGTLGSWHLALQRYHTIHLCSLKPTIKTETNMYSINTIITLIASVSLAYTSAIPSDQSTANILEKRADLRCPGSDGSMYTGPKGGQWRIRCGQDCRSPYINNGIVNSVTFEQCIQSCGARPNECSIVNFTGDVYSGGTCYLKKNCGGDLQTKSGVKTAIKLN